MQMIFFERKCCFLFYFFVSNVIHNFVYDKRGEKYQKNATCPVIKNKDKIYFDTCYVECCMISIYCTHIVVAID